MSHPGTSRGTLAVLLVCTGNICRSAMGERLGRAFLDETLGERTGRIRLASAGTRAVVGSGMHPHSALVLAGFGGDATDFRAQQLTDGIAAEADLTLTMTRGHQREVLARAPRALARTFTLREAADLLRFPGDVEAVVEEAFPNRARALVAQMAAARSRRPSGPADDIPDPIGSPLDVHQEVGEAIADALLPVLRRLADLVGPNADRRYGASPDV